MFLVEGLSTDAEAIDAALGEGLHEFRDCGFWVAFDGELALGVGAHLGEIERGVQGFEEDFPEVWWEQGWGAAPDKDRI